MKFAFTFFTVVKSGSLVWTEFRFDCDSQFTMTNMLNCLIETFSSASALEFLKV